MAGGKVGRGLLNSRRPDFWVRGYLQYGKLLYAFVLACIYSYIQIKTAWSRYSMPTYWYDRVGYSGIMYSLVLWPAFSGVYEHDKWNAVYGWITA